VEVALVDEAACFVDYDECVDDPVLAIHQLCPMHLAEGRGGEAYMVVAYLKLEEKYCGM
jgi:hypothetical protein